METFEPPVELLPGERIEAGRDSLTVALIVADIFPRLLETTVLHLARFQGRQDDARVEQPPQEIQAWTVASMVAIEHGA
jgi:hypothetical protein